MIELRLKTEPTAPLESDSLLPDRLCELSASELGAVEIFHGRRRYRLKDFFDIEVFEEGGEAEDSIRLHGNLEKLRWLGKGMSRGSVEVRGHVGMHLGAYMTGGRISVSGNAGDWVGAEMRNGSIHIAGNAGNRIGAAYVGSLRGMKNGFIRVDGQAGQEVGQLMRRGTIAIGGSVGEFCGLRMKGGTIVLSGGAGPRAAAWMNRGTIISFQALDLPPTFRTCGLFASPFIAILERHLQSYGVQFPQRWQSGSFVRSTGDLTARVGKGEVLVWHPPA
jgi:formylmethanofuran dehydrogenase subunit C